MKSKIMILKIISLFIFSCKSDDESSGTPEIPENEKYLNEITGQDFSIKLTYTPDKKVESVNIGSSMLYMFTYDGNQIKTMQYISNDGPELLYRFTYESNRISSFSINDYKIQMNWNQSNRSYFFKNDNKDEITIILNENEDLNKVYHYVHEDDETKVTNYFYEGSRKGAMTNSNHISAYMAITSYFNINGIYAGVLSKKNQSKQLIFKVYFFRLKINMIRKNSFQKAVCQREIAHRLQFYIITKTINKTLESLTFEGF